MANLNDPYTRPSSNKPRGIVRVNESIVSGWLDFEVEQNGYYSADTFTVTFATGLLPEEFSAAWFSQQQLLYVEIFAGFPQDADNYTVMDLDSLIYGRVDDFSFDPVNGLITLSGRDFTSVLIDTKTTAQFQNKTASEIASDLATSHGLTPVVTETKTPVGQYFKVDHVSLLEERSDWDWLTYFASIEGFRAFVRGKELHFEPIPEAGDAYIVQWQPPDDNRDYAIANATRLTFTRNMTISKGITVVVRSWNQKQKTAFESSFPRSPKTLAPGRAKLANDRVVYTFTVAGKTREETERIAEQKYNEIIRHEKRMQWIGPGDSEADRTKIVRVLGTGTEFDQDYHPLSIVRTMEQSVGYTMTILATNQSAETTL